MEPGPAPPPPSKETKVTKPEVNPNPQVAEPQTTVSAVEFRAPLPKLPEEPPRQPDEQSRRLQQQYGFSYWQNGWRKQTDDASSDTLVLETGRYGLTLDMDDFRNARFGFLEDGADYGSAAGQGDERIGGLDPVQLNFDVKVGGKVYRAIRCRAGTDTDVKRLRWARLWEAGRYLQRFELLELVLEDARGERLECNARLELVSWPDSLTLTGTITPGVLYADGPHPGANGTGLCVVNKTHSLPHKEGMDHDTFSLEAWVNVPSALAVDNKGYLIGKNGGPGASSHFGFTLEEGQVAAIMNVPGGREHEQRISQRRDAFHLDNWNHLVLTYDGKDMVFYVNGEPMGHRTIALPRKAGDGPLFIGGGPHPGMPPVGGLYDQILIWNRPLSGEEVQQHALDARTLGDRRGLTYMELFKSRRRLKSEKPVWEKVAMRMQLKNDAHTWEAQDRVVDTWEAGDEKSVTVTCDLRKKPVPTTGVKVRVTPPGGGAQDADFDPRMNCYLAEVKQVQRRWRTGYTDIREYDEFPITITNAGDPLEVPVQLYLRSVANITGLCPILCYPDGRPTGIPVQLSKNWHYKPLGSYLRSSMLIPAPSGESRYLLRIPYGFYGTLPSASHAQLSLVGYGGNGRWEQLAIGCWGETMCFDMDMSCVDNIVTDVRGLMFRNGERGRKWSWTDAGWGGDWLRAYDAKRRMHMPREWKTTYHAHGPCLTEVRYTGQYGSGGEVAVDGTVRTLRTDDYARTFQTLAYRVNRDVDLQGGWLFKMGKTGQYHTPRVAYGNRAGLIADKRAPDTLRPGKVWLAPMTLEGEGPWWISLPEAYARDGGKRLADGTRALIIRKHQAVLGGKPYANPTVQVAPYVVHGKEPSLDILLTLPPGVSRLQMGDRVDLDIEWITQPREAADYYGGNDTFRAALKAHPNSWEPVYREVVGNDLTVQASGGSVTHTYPVIVQAKGPEVMVEISGGVGMVPLRFEGLHAPVGYTLYQVLADSQRKKLDQAAHGNDFWQTDYDAVSNSWRRTYNLPLDGLDRSTWVLVRETGSSR